ncbi:MAG: ABC transporter permease [Flavobacteriaceae bacterium]|nr:ABC transporter permease [Flavobacteriaceae bacterium]
MNIKAIRLLFHYQFLSSFLRNKETLIYTIFLPSFLFIIFGLAFRIDSRYASFFLPGVIGSIIASDGFYAVGPVIKNYYTLQVVRYFRGYPLNIIWLFITFILTRLIFIGIASIIVIILSVYVFDFTPSFKSLIFYLIGIVLGFSIYSLIGLTISLFGIKDNKDQALLTPLYLMSIFLSDAFFNLSSINSFFSIISYLFPLTPVLDFMREGDLLSLLYCLIWLLISLTLYYVKLNSMGLKRL